MTSRSWGMKLDVFQDSHVFRLSEQFFLVLSGVLCAAVPLFSTGRHLHYCVRRLIVNAPFFGDNVVQSQEIRPVSCDIPWSQGGEDETLTFSI
jgi:hypothetical protein